MFETHRRPPEPSVLAKVTTELLNYVPRSFSKISLADYCLEARKHQNPKNLTFEKTCAKEMIEIHLTIVCPNSVSNWKVEGIKPKSSPTSINNDMTRAKQ